MSNSGDFRCINMMDIIIDEEARSFILNSPSY